MSATETAKELFLKGLACLDEDDFAGAEALFERTLELAEGHIATLNNLAVAQFRQNKFDEAALTARTLMKLDDRNLAAHSILSNCLIERADYDAALKTCEILIAIDPNDATSHRKRSFILNAMGRYQDARISSDVAIELQPQFAEAFLDRGNSLQNLDCLHEALAAYDKALSLKSDLFQASLGRGDALLALNRHDEAMAAYDQALALQPGLANAHIGRGNLFFLHDQLEEAMASYDKALAIKPDMADACVGRGNLLFLLHRHDEAMASYDKAISLKPEMAEAWLGRANLAFIRRQFEHAFSAYDKAFSFNPDLIGVEGGRLHAKMQMCDWQNFDEECQHLISSVRSDKVNTNPFAFFGISDDSEDQLRCARSWASKYYPARATRWQGDRYDHSRIRVAYLSADFGDHAVFYLMAGILEQHDRNRFETTAISFGPHDTSQNRKRLVAAVDRFIDVRNQSSQAIAGLMRTLEIDIAVDLMGYTAGARPAIFENRSAPIQVNYLGYPGTMGAPFIDYLISDPTLIPLAHRESYVEKIVHLPDSYMPNDDLTRVISEKHFERSEFGLPKEGFVFCCFNNAYKLNPEIFDRWGRILTAVNGSVLWLSAMTTIAAANLKREMGARGVDPDRLVFANRVGASADHLARHRLADLFLDTLPYNAHTTASDALLTGLPVLTRIGEAFAGRVAASLLNALGLTELITNSREEYERTAIDLATNPAKMALIKEKLNRNRLNAPLFNTRMFTRNIEAAYVAMHSRFQAGSPPDHIRIPEL